jgi:acetylglutamate kinase
MNRPLVLKFGGELLEDPDRLARVVSAVARVVRPGGSSGPGARVLIVHGGGKEIDRALESAGIVKQQVDGLRVTDAATLEVVVAVLAGAVNTRFVAALAAAGVRAVGLTGADAACGLSDEAPPHRAVDGRSVDLGRVGIPRADSDTTLLTTLLDRDFVPVVACIGVMPDGRLLNVNADTLAGHLAARLGARRLAIAGTTPGVVGSGGTTTPLLDGPAIEQLVASRTATAGMIAKLRACEQAVSAGVGDAVIIDGREESAIVAAATGAIPPNATQVAGLAASGKAAAGRVDAG